MILNFKEYVNESKYSNLSDEELNRLLNDALDKGDSNILNKISEEISKRNSKDKPKNRVDRFNIEVSKKFDISSMR